MEPTPVSGASPVSQIPLFPLDLVLFPQMLVPLHIFEERYKVMINRCVRESMPFGVVLVTGVDEATGNVTTSSIGCSARIARVERLPDGRMNIEVVGESRFRLLDAFEVQPYRTGLIEPIHDQPADAAAMAPLTEEVRDLLHDFLLLHLERLGQRVSGFELPEEPEQLSFTAACVLPLENPQKQEFLEGTDTESRLRAAREVLHQEVDRMRQAPEAPAETAETVWIPVTSERFTRYRCPN